MGYDDFGRQLKGVFGAIKTTLHVPNTTIASASGEGVISYDPAWMHGLTFTVSANNTAIDLRYVNASATGVLTPVLFNVKCLQLGTNTIWFDKPLNFDKGFMYQLTASGAATPQLHVHWEPGPNPLRGN